MTFTIKKANNSTLIVILCVITSVLSQIEDISGVMRPLMYASWLLLLAYLLVANRFKIYLSFGTKMFAMLFSLLLAMGFVLSIVIKDYALAGYIKVMFIPLIVCFCAEQYKYKTDEYDIQLIIKVYIACALAYAVWVNIIYFSSFDIWLEQMVYVFTGKNSAAQIWSTAVLMIAFFLEYKTVIGRIIGYAVGAYLLFIIGLSQCRTAILALCVAAAVFALVKSKHKLVWALFFAAVFIFLWFYGPTREFIDKSLFLTKYEGADFNTFSSGRVDLWKDAINEFFDSPFIGNGNYYVDCSYILILAETGILGFLLIEPIWIYRAVNNFRFSVSPKAGTFITLLTVFYFVESLLEGYPPFGPGVSSFMFWFLSILLATETYDFESGI